MNNQMTGSLQGVQTALLQKEEQTENKKLLRREKAFIAMIAILMGMVFFSGLFLAGRFLVNEFYNLMYREGFYLNRAATAKMVPEKPEGYIQYYNTACNDFRNGRYEEAAELNQKALEEAPFHENGLKAEEEKSGRNDIEDAECKIRINLALSVLYQIDFANIHMNDRKEVEQAAEKLLIARKALTDGKCAHFTDTGGHNFEAEELKKEIDELLNRLNYKPPQEEDEPNQKQKDNQQEPNEKNEDEQSRREKEIQKQLEDEMSDAKEQQVEAGRDKDRRDGYDMYNEDTQNW